MTWKIDAYSALPRFGIERAAFTDEVAYVGDVDAQLPRCRITGSPAMPQRLGLAGAPENGLLVARIRLTMRSFKIGRAIQYPQRDRIIEIAGIFRINRNDQFAPQIVA